MEYDIDALDADSGIFSAGHEKLAKKFKSLSCSLSLIKKVSVFKQITLSKTLLNLLYKFGYKLIQSSLSRDI